MGRDRFGRQSFGALHKQIKQSRVLLIGAGGIGCELLKNLAMTGFGHADIIDLDTIDLSNLNRQFLFRHEHIKKPKAIVAKEVASRFNPSCSLTAHHANIKDTSLFPVSYYRTFTVVFNALDNLDARRHVNKMCLAADVPLIESGTTGFNGQVQVIKKDKTACYDCTEKEVPKTYPVCTIRSTPSQPIHCIVWAKSYLLPELFGLSEDEISDQVDTTMDSDNAEEIAKLKAEAQALKKIREGMGEANFAEQVFNKVFQDDINRLRGMEDMWKSRKAPIALDYATLYSSTDQSTLSDQQPWTLSENVGVFTSSLDRLRTRFQNTASQPIVFDKDDPDTLDLVTSASNIRSYVFSIPLNSKFATKQMAGNIIPAIATTNAMVAGLCVLQSLKVLRGDLMRAKMLFLETSGVRVLNSEPPREPNPECAVCSVTTAEVQVDSRAKLRDLVEGLLQKELGYGELTIMNDRGPIYDPDLEEQLDRTFVELGVVDGGTLIVVDEDDLVDGAELGVGVERLEPRVDLLLYITATTIPEPEPPVRLALLPAVDPDTTQNTLKTDDSAPASTTLALSIPRKPKKPTPAPAPPAAQTLKPAKRTAQQAGLDDFDGDLGVDDLKRRVRAHSLSGERPIVIEDGEERNGENGTGQGGGEIVIEDSD